MLSNLHGGFCVVRGQEDISKPGHQGGIRRMCSCRLTHLIGVHQRLLVVRCGDLLCRLLLPLGPAAEEDVVDQGVLQQGEEHEDEAAHQVHVDGLDVGDLGQGLPQVGVDGCHGEHRGDAWEETAENQVKKQL